jgi:hypothetical protein
VRQRGKLEAFDRDNRHFTGLLAKAEPWERQQWKDEACPEIDDPLEGPERYDPIQGRDPYRREDQSFDSRQHLSSAPWYAEGQGNAESDGSTSVQSASEEEAAGPTQKPEAKREPAEAVAAPAELPVKAVAVPEAVADKPEKAPSAPVAVEAQPAPVPPVPVAVPSAPRQLVAQPPSAVSQPEVPAKEPARHQVGLLGVFAVLLSALGVLAVQAVLCTSCRELKMSDLFYKSLSVNEKQDDYPSPRSCKSNLTPRKQNAQKGREPAVNSPSSRPPLPAWTGPPFRAHQEGTEHGWG